MKLHRIELKNLNSLYGEHQIDVTSRLKDAPVFLINGPTGSGKSTLMDAVSLALFGQTPRLSRQRGRDDTDSRQIMSYGTAECLAAVEFSKREADGERRRYRAEWSCHRARNKPDGLLQEPERSLYRIDADGARTLLVSGKLAKVVDPVFRKVLEGLTVEEFQRTILLAQGEFAAFLKADEEQRANMLERLTNTDIYQRIGKRAADLKRLKEAELKRLQDQYGSLSPLSAEDVASLEQRLELTRQDIQRMGEAVERMREAEQWLEQDAGLASGVVSARVALERADIAAAVRAEDFERLAEDERCRPALEVWRDSRRVDAEVAGIEGELPGLASRERDLEATVAAAQADEAAAGARKEAQEVALEAARPALAESRRLRQAWQNAREGLEAVDRRFQEASTREQQGRAAYDKAERQRIDAVAQLEAARLRLVTVAHAEPLTQQLAGFAARLERLQSDRRQLEATETRLRDETAKQEGRRKQRSLTAESLAREEAAAARFEQVVIQARQGLEVQLAGAASVRDRREALQQEQEALQERLQSLKEAARLAGSLVELEQTAGKVAAELERLERAHTEAAGTVQAREARRPVIEERLRTLEDQRGLAHLALRLSDERAALRDGQPCPLCGSVDHPLVASGAHEATDREIREKAAALEQSFEAARAELTALDRETSILHREVAGLEAAREGQQGHRERLEADRERITTGMREALTAAGLPESAGEGSIAQARRALQSSLETVNDDRRALEDAEANAAKQEKELARRKEAILAHRREQTGLDAELAGGEKTLEALEGTLAALRAEIEREAGALEGALEEAGITVPEKVGAPDLAGALELARALVERSREAARGVEAADAAQKEALGAREVAKARHDEAVAAIEALRGELKAHRQSVAEAESRAKASLEGRDPDAVERSLSQAVREAEGALTQARQVLHESQRRLTAVQSGRKAKEEQLEARRQAASDLKARLAGQLTALGLADSRALEQRLLSDEDRARLVKETRQLEETRTVARARVAEAVERLAIHRDARPAALEMPAETEPGAGSEATTPPEPRSLETVRQERLATAQQLSEMQKTAGALQDRLEEHARKATTLADLGRRLEAARREFELWRQLHDVIGVGDGKRFKTFAQILNLQDLIDRANIRLEHLAPRYSLTIARDAEGEPRLSFAVSDAHHAGSERPLTTLSGGETFLVSLALALALADYRTVQMPIETLLLDEGFGTLDADTLNTAMDALERLRSRNPNCQIGIISHVEGLAERVEARILVGKLGNGRSDIRLEFGGVTV